MPGRLHRHETRRGEAGGREAAPVNYVPHVVAWNLTRRCNLECAHCYIAAGPRGNTSGGLHTAARRGIPDPGVAGHPTPVPCPSGGGGAVREGPAPTAR